MGNIIEPHSIHRVECGSEDAIWLAVFISYNLRIYLKQTPRLLAPDFDTFSVLKS